MPRIDPLFALVAALVVLVDQAVKAYAVVVWAERPVDLGLVRLVAVRNPNGAFSLPGFPGMFLIVLVVVLVLVLRALPHAPGRTAVLAYGLVVGGALGNGVDRVVRAPGFPAGAVVDWIDLGWFPVFNVADIAINIGAALLVLMLSRAERHAPPAVQEAQHER